MKIISENKQTIVREGRDKEEDQIGKSIVTSVTTQVVENHVCVLSCLPYKIREERGVNCYTSFLGNSIGISE